MMRADDSEVSSQQDDDGSEDGETDDHSQEDYQLSDEQLERRTTGTHGGAQRNNLAPQSMQWAIRHRDTTRNSVRLTSGSSLVLIDPAALRRTTSASAAVAAAQEPHTMATTASSLARAFGIVLRQVCQLFNTITDLNSNGMLHSIDITFQEANALHVSVVVTERDLKEVFIKRIPFTEHSRCMWRLASSPPGTGFLPSWTQPKRSYASEPR